MKRFEEGELVGASKVDALHDVSSTSVDRLMTIARDSLFEEELFFEVLREARILLSYDVKVKGSTVIIPLRSRESQHGRDGEDFKSYISVELVSSEQAVSANQQLLSDTLSQSIALGLRLFLCFAHRNILWTRSQPPPPLTDRPRRSAPLPLLRPLINHLKHFLSVDALTALLRAVSRILTGAGLRAKFTLDYESSLIQMADSIKTVKSADSAAGNTLHTLISPLNAIAKLQLPSSTDVTAPRAITILIRTHAAPPTYGSQFAVQYPRLLTTDLHAGGPDRGTVLFDSFGELETYICFLLSLDVARHILAPLNRHGWVLDARWPALSKRRDNRPFEERVTVQLSRSRLDLLLANSLQSDPTDCRSWHGTSDTGDFLSVVDEIMK